MKNTKKIFMVVAIFISFFAAKDTFATTTINNLRYGTAKLYTQLDGDLSSMTSFDILADITEDDEDINISTTYKMRGYGTFLKVEDSEKVANFGEKTSLDGVDLNINAALVNDSQITVTYTVTNNSGSVKDVSVASIADIDIMSDDSNNDGIENDNAAIVRNSNHRGFTITQDDASVPGYGLSYNIDLNPYGTTTWIGDYSNNDIYYGHYRYSNGTVDSITFADRVDTALTYSWSNTLFDGETKTYTATFSAEVFDMETINYYAYNDFETVHTTRSAVLNGALTMPATTGPLTKGYNYKWNSKRDGNGYAVDGGETIIYDGTTAFYEYKYKNGVIIPNGEDEDDDYRTIVTPSNEAMDDFIHEAEETYGDVEIETEVYLDTDQDIIELMAGEDVIESFDEDKDPAALLQVIMTKITTDSTGTKVTDYLYDPTKISIILPESLTDAYNNFSIVKIDIMNETIISQEDIDYDEETGRIEFTCTPSDFYIIVGSYIDAPDTGFLTTNNNGGASSGIILAAITATAALSTYYYIIIYRKQRPIILDRQ